MFAENIHVHGGYIYNSKTRFFGAFIFPEIKQNAKWHITPVEEEKMNNAKSQNCYSQFRCTKISYCSEAIKEVVHWMKSFYKKSNVAQRRE